MTKMSQLETSAYTAGIVDGEGSIHLRQNRNRVDFVVSTTSKELANWMEYTWGGKIYQQHFNIEQNRKVMHRWTTTGEHAAQILQILLPYLKIKNHQAELAIKYVYSTDLNFKKDAATNMHILNKRGLN